MWLEHVDTLRGLRPHVLSAAPGLCSLPSLAARGSPGATAAPDFSKPSPQGCHRPDHSRAVSSPRAAGRPVVSFSLNPSGAGFGVSAPWVYLLCRRPLLPVRPPMGIALLLPEDSCFLSALLGMWDILTFALILQTFE